jgi:hypothetical protein
MHQHPLTSDFVIRDKSLHSTRGERFQKLVFFPEFHWLVVFLCTIDPRIDTTISLLLRSEFSLIAANGWLLQEKTALPDAGLYSAVVRVTASKITIEPVLGSVRKYSGVCASPCGSTPSVRSPGLWR